MNEPKDLVTDGPYRYTRTTFYISVVCILAGEAHVVGHIGLLAYTGIVWGVFSAAGHRQ